MKKFYNIKNINNKIKSDPRKLVLDVDSSYRGELFKVANKILSKRSNNIVLLAGPSCAGKTTSARLLKEIFERDGKNVVVISLDDFFLDRDKTPTLPNGLKDFDSLNSINCELLKKCFESFFSGKETYFPEFNFLTGTNNPNGYKLTKQYNTIIIFEGLHVLNPEIYKILGEERCYKIYVNALSGFKATKESMESKDVRLFRRIVRDISRRELSVQTTLKNWPIVCEAEDKYITPYKKGADSIINTTHEYEIGVLKSAFEDLISLRRASFKQLDKFDEVLKDCLTIDKSLLPKTTLMWEFIDPPKEEDKLEKKDE